jgi:hypothetical protein
METLRLRPAFGALPRFRAGVLTGSPPALECRLICLT